jgi:hypothetical protein
MAIKIPIITELQDEGIAKAKREFDKFKSAVAGAEGTMGKFKAGGKAAMDAIAKNALVFAASATAAIVTFGVKGVMAFQNLAIASGKFADSTGLAVDEASRWIEVAGDIGIEAGTVESAIGKMNKVLGTTPDKFRELGVEIAYTSGGAMDANGTFLNVIDRLNGIKNPAERARVASELLGKGWQSMSELIGQGSDKLRKSLDQVSDAKVVDPKELEQARRFRQQMDDLKDSVGDLSMAVGTDLLPAVIALADAFLFVYKKAKEFFDLMQLGTDITQTATFQAMTAADDMGKAWRDGARSMIDAYNASKYLITGLDDASEATHDLNIAWEQLMGQFKVDDAIREAQRQVQNLKDAAAEAFADPTKILDYDEALQNAYKSVANLIEIIGLSNSEQNRIKLLVDTGEVESAIRLLDIMANNPGTSLTNAMRFRGARAAGGPVTAGGTYLVGERGPELLTMGARGGYVTPNSAMGATVNVTVTSADPNQVVAAIQRWVRDNGAVPMTTTTAIRR